MDLFVRESGPVGAPAIVFLHGGRLSGWSWDPVVERMRRRHHCLVPDLPQYGKSFQQGPFEMSRAADAVAELIRSRAGTGRAHVVGFSLGAQVGIQLMANEPTLADRAVLCGTFINTLPGVSLTQNLLGALTRSTPLPWLMNRQWIARHAGLPEAQYEHYREDVRRMTDAHTAHIVMASAGFTVPVGLDESEVPTLFLSGEKERKFVRHWAATLAQTMPNGVDGVVNRMPHDWPLSHPDLFASTISDWLSAARIHPQIVLPNATD